VTLPRSVSIPAHIDAVAETDYATTLSAQGESIRTVEHMLSALHALGITNLLIKVHGEIPVLDGSALEFCRRIQEIGIEEQDAPRQEVVIDRRYELGDGTKSLVVEPSETLSVSYLLRYPPPIGEQFFDFTLSDIDGYIREIAPARTFGFLRDLKMINELGLGSGGRLWWATTRWSTPTCASRTSSCATRSSTSSATSPCSGTRSVVASRPASPATATTSRSSARSSPRTLKTRCGSPGKAGRGHWPEAVCVRAPVVHSDERRHLALKARRLRSKSSR